MKKFPSPPPELEIPKPGLVEPEIPGPGELEISMS
jgi:hypothetical protein